MSTKEYMIGNGKVKVVQYDLEVYGEIDGVLSFSIVRDDGTRYCGEVSKCDRSCSKQKEKVK